jgi:hypothetical protein
MWRGEVKGRLGACKSNRNHNHNHERRPPVKIQLFSRVIITSHANLIIHSQIKQGQNIYRILRREKFQIKVHHHLEISLPSLENKIDNFGT